MKQAQSLNKYCGGNEASVHRKTSLRLHTIYKNLFEMDLNGKLNDKVSRRKQQKTSWAQRVFLRYDTENKIHRN